MNWRRLSVAVGLLALALAAVAIAAPGLVPIGVNRALVLVVGIGALLLSAWAIQSRRHADLAMTETGDPERAAPTPRPGDDLGAILAEYADRGAGTDQQYHTREALGTVAESVLCRFGSMTEAEAREAVERGTWTDDSEAAAFLGSARSLETSLLPVLRDAIRNDTAFERGRRHTIAELARTVGLELSPDGDTTGDEEHGADGREGGPTAAETAAPSATAPSPDGGTVSAGTVGAAALGAGPVTTEHWRGVSVVAYVGVGLGVLVQQPAVVLAGVVGIGFVAYERSADRPSTSVAVDRSVSTERPEPGEEVQVTVTVENTGEATLTDLRFVDGVPAGLAVAEGSPRLGTVLRPDGAETLEYTLTARRGVHEFDPALALSRNLANTAERERRLGPATTVTCVPPLETLTEPMALRPRGNQLVGREDAESAGAGTEFHSTREYRRGDPLARIDWNRRARTGKLSTVEFREEKAATVVLLIDARMPAYVSPTTEPPHAVDRAVDAAGQLFDGLRSAGHRVGIAAAPAESCWLAPGADVDHAVAARDLLATHPALDPVAPARRAVSSHWERTLRRRLSAGTQLVYLTPLADEDAAAIARRFDERGFPVTVVSVNPTVDATPGNRLARVTRALRRSELRSAGVPVLDWAWDEPLAAAIARANERGPP